jgi:hypothetical protein
MKSLVDNDKSLSVPRIYSFECTMSTDTKFINLTRQHTSIGMAFVEIARAIATNVEMTPN